MKINFLFAKKIPGPAKSKEPVAVRIAETKAAPKATVKGSSDKQSRARPI